MRIAEGTAKILASIPLPDEVAAVHRQAAIVDVGSWTTRIGFAGDDAPRIDAPTCVVKGDEKGTAALCLKKAYDRRATTDVSRVIDGGEVDWEAMEQLLCYLDDLLQLSSKEVNTPLLLTEKMLVPRQQRQKMAEILMEKHGVNSIHFSLSPVLALYAAGVCSGVSVEMGHNACHVVPVFQGYPLFHATHALNFAGDFCTRYMMSTGPELPSMVHPSHRKDVWAYVKEKYCECSPSAALFRKAREEEAAPNADGYRGSNSSGGAGLRAVQYQLPDGTIISLDSNRFVPAEMLLDPALLTSDLLGGDQTLIDNMEQLRTSTQPEGLHRLILDAVSKCDQDLAPMLENAIHLSGGCSLLRGFPERLRSEIDAALSHNCNVVARTERRHAAFVGGSILASLPTFQGFWVTKADHDEFGSSAVLRRCF
ncbi:putative actin-like protein [Trypanosoma conorhini]|uniref:Putative actin-like protein n=1 Tax=Trypanosoma conorhini TaxID=83891 RepID=A0A422NU65_9TRYP|nr:putative actin-like protein [Trypanosoma conorhini]RNF09002.1 putative actin-like protein [Trypanosoma conorhini]